LAIHLPDVQALCYVYVANTKIAYAVIADDQYPERIVYLILRKMHTEFNKDLGAAKFASITGTSHTISVDQNEKWNKMETWIKEFQDPKEVDKL
jgi:synaptobrevin family protein YKT6